MASRARRDSFDTARRAGNIVLWIVIGLWIAEAVVWLTGAHGAVELAITVVLGLTGAVVGVRDARSVEPTPEPERRNAVIGWGIAGVLIAGLLAATVFG